MSSKKSKIIRWLGGVVVGVSLLRVAFIYWKKSKHITKDQKSTSSKTNESNDQMREDTSSSVSNVSHEETKHCPLVVSGPSGVGKGTLVGMLLKDYPDFFSKSVSHTTRKPRQGEVNGKSYHFVSMEDMKRDIEQGKFVEHAHVHGNLYGTSISSVEDVARSGKICILDIDVQGAERLYSMKQWSPHFFFIHPPSLAELEQRLRKRGTEDEQTIQLRIKNANDEIAFADSHSNIFTHRIENADLRIAYTVFRDNVLRCYPLIAQRIQESSASSQDGINNNTNGINKPKQFKEVSVEVTVNAVNNGKLAAIEAAQIAAKKTKKNENRNG